MSDDAVANKNTGPRLLPAPFLRHRAQQQTLKPKPNMKVKSILTTGGLALALTAQSAFGLSDFVSQIPNGSILSCSTCHTSGFGWNPFGQELQEQQSGLERYAGRPGLRRRRPHQWPGTWRS